MSLVVESFSKSLAGIKTRNDDALALHLPEKTGIGRRRFTLAAAIADGVSVSKNSQQAAAISTQSFCSDFFTTDSQWSIKTAGIRVVESVNRWLYGNSSQPDFLTTFSGVIIQGQQAHLFHVGDSRIWLFRNGALQQLTHDHVMPSEHGQQLIRALGLDWHVDLEYQQIDLQVDDLLLLTTDGLHQFLSNDQIVNALQSEQVNDKGEQLLQLALENGSDDNLSCQILHIKTLDLAEPNRPLSNTQLQVLPDTLQTGDIVDGYEIIKELQISPRSSVYQAKQLENQKIVALKAPSPHFENDTEILEAFLQEEWIAQRLTQPDIIKTYSRNPDASYLYQVQEFLEGQNLRQWKAQNPEAPVETVMQFARPVILALRALHRRETLHHDIKPDNLFLTTDSKLKLIDFGSASVGSFKSSLRPHAGAAEYAAPEYTLNAPIDWRVDQFALAFTFYYLLTGKLPYGDSYINAQTLADYEKLTYSPASIYNPHIPIWLDAALMKACAILPEKRYDDLGEFLTDLTTPNHQLVRPKKALAEQYPVQFWQIISTLLFLGHILWFIWLFK